MEKPLPPRIFWLPALFAACNLYDGNFCGGFFSKTFPKMRVFGRPNGIIHIIPIRAFHQKWTKKPPETVSFQHCTQVMHKVIHRFGGFWGQKRFANVCGKYAKLHTKTLYHRLREKEICAGKSYDWGTLGRRIWFPQTPPERLLLGWVVAPVRAAVSLRRNERVGGTKITPPLGGYTSFVTAKP